MAKYYIYIDDSGKFRTGIDGHVIYSYLVFDKEQRENFNSNFIFYSSQLRKFLSFKKKKTFKEKV